MAFLNLLRRKYINRKDNEQQEVIIKFKEDNNRKSSVSEICNDIIESIRQIDEAKVEYQAVTSYLADIQKVDNIPLEEKSEIEDAARSIYNLTNERVRHQNRKRIKITDSQYRIMEQYEDIIPDEILKMKKSEEYKIVVKNDMRNLEGEKGAIIYQQEEIGSQQQFLKIISVITSVIVLGLFALFLYISTKKDKGMTVPFLLTIIMATVSGMYIFYEARQNRYHMLRSEKMMHRAITLLNHVKIKYVNVTNLLDYSHSKYMVNSSAELQYIWEQYIKAKDEEKRYQNNTELLNYYNETLISKLKKHQINDPEIWIHQSIAIINDKEMVEIRHRLNARRQKLRERIDYNSKMKEDNMAIIQDMVKKNPPCREEVIKVLKGYEILV